jgi:hypothetical protein
VSGVYFDRPTLRSNVLPLRERSIGHKDSEWIATMAIDIADSDGSQGSHSWLLDDVSQS